MDHGCLGDFEESIKGRMFPFNKGEKKKKKGVRRRKFYEKDTEKINDNSIDPRHDDRRICSGGYR